MRLVVFGATGGCGRELVAQAIERGHDVAAVVRGDPVLPEGVVRLEGNVLDPEFVASAISGRDAVLSALGLRRRYLFPWSGLLSPPDFASNSARNIVAGMRIHGVSRVIAISAAGVADSERAMNAPMRFLVATSDVGVAYRDLAVMERIYAESGLDWTCVRPVTLTDGARTGRARVVPGFGLTATVSRADVAAWMLDQLGAPGAEPRLPQLAS